MKKLLSLVIAVFAIALASTSFAKPEEGWHKGFYALAGGGYLNVDHDANVSTTPNTIFGSNRIMGYGLTFGWNFLDFLAAELQLRYGTETAGVNNQKEHAANINLNAKYSIILDALTRMEKVRFIPYVKAGGGMFGAAVPDTSAGNDRFGVFGPTIDFGAGMEVLISKIFYVGAEFTEDLAFLKEKNNAAGQRILAGGFDPQDSVFGYLGIHF